MYGKAAYGTKTYAEDNMESGKEEHYKDLFSLVPVFISEKIEMHEIYTAQGYEIGYLQYALEDVLQQCILANATWGLNRWEKIFGLKESLQLTYEQRRELIFTKMRGHGTATKKMIKDVAASFSGGEVEIIEDNKNSLFIVRFVGIKGIPRNMQGFIEMLEIIKPAHLSYRFEYRYTIWDDLEIYNWADTDKISWSELRLLEED